MRIERFLKFEGKSISILLNEDQWWVAIKPICEVIGVEYTRQFKNLKEHKILSQLLAEQPMVGADGKLRKMTCLPEKFIYGWLFSINSENENLIKYQMACYEILYNHFHGSVLYRMSKLTEKLQVTEKLMQISDSIKNSDLQKEFNSLKKKSKEIDKHLKLLDNDLVTGQISLDFTDSKNTEADSTIPQ